MAALNRAIAQDDSKRLRDAAERLLDIAAAGEAWAIKELADRLDGKPHQSTSLENPDGTSLFTGITVNFVRPNS
jgi:HPt (histidine-containing phosphotransfer) domain-containing protein